MKEAVAVLPRSLRFALVALATLVAVGAPLVALAAHQFSDVPDSSPYHGDIDAITDAGVTTTGCGGGKYCPKDNVTREQMAAFMNRLGALAPGKKPVVNADRLDGLSSEDFVAAGSPLDAETLDGLSSEDFVAMGSSLDAETLDGLSSEDFVATASVEGWRVVGDQGQPAFGPAVNDCEAADGGGDPNDCGGWANYDPTGEDFSTAAFYRDPLGEVHLRGVVFNPEIGSSRNRTIFVLPEGYRPAQPLTLAGITYDGGGSSQGNRAHLLGSFYVEPDGRVVFARAGSVYLSMDGLTFRAE